MSTSDYSNHSKKYKKHVDYESDEWTALKQRRRELDGNRCVCCGRPGFTCRNGLQTHHLTYDRLGHEDIRDIISVCGSCHAALENRMVLKPGQYDPRTPEAQARLQSYLDITNVMLDKIENNTTKYYTDDNLPNDSI